MLLTVKSREIQRGLTAAMCGQLGDAKKHFRAAGHLELVLADDYEQAGETELARRSRISAASCFWRAGEDLDAQAILDELLQVDPSRAGEIQDLIGELKAG
jgi:hypothetical protein